MADLTAAIYVALEADRVLVEEALRKDGKKLGDFSTAWRNQRIRRTIAAGAVTQAAVSNVLQKYRGQICLATGEPVVDAAVERVYEEQGKASIDIYGKQLSPFDLMEGAAVAGCCVCCC
jgi:hypothetical protein